MFISFSLTALQVLLQPHSWKLIFTGCGHEEKVCRETLSGDIGKPWCYRLLSAWITYPFSLMGPWGFIILRLIQNMAIVLLFPSDHIWMLVLAMTIGYLGTDFRFNTYTETIFLLLCIRWPILLVPIGILAALNRETFAVFYPYFIYLNPGYGIASLILFGITTLLVRSLIKSDKLTCPQFAPGFKLAWRNLISPLAWGLNLSAYPGLWMVPFNEITIIPWACFFLNLVGNLFFGNMRETALSLNPYILLISFI